MKKKSVNKVEFNDNDWQSEQDARTLTEAISIRKDPERRKNAVKYAKAKLQQLKGVITEDMEDADFGEDDE